MEHKLTLELMEKAKQAESVKELMSIAKENGIELSTEEAETYFGKMNQSGELSDEELDDVAGGGCSGEKPDGYVDYLKNEYQGKRVLCKNASCPTCGSQHGIILQTSMTNTGWDDFWCHVYCSTHQNQLIIKTNEMDMDFVME